MQVAEQATGIAQWPAFAIPAPERGSLWVKTLSASAIVSIAERRDQGRTVVLQLRHTIGCPDSLSEFCLDGAALASELRLEVGALAACCCCCAGGVAPCDAPDESDVAGDVALVAVPCAPPPPVPAQPVVVVTDELERAEGETPVEPDELEGDMVVSGLMPTTAF